MTTKLQNFLNKAKVNADLIAVKMANLELSIHDNADHQKELKQYFGFTDKALAKRKVQLIRNAGK